MQRNVEWSIPRCGWKRDIMTTRIEVTRNTWLRLCIQLHSSCWSLGNCSRDSRELKGKVMPPQTPTRYVLLSLPLPRYGFTFIFMYKSCCSRKHRQCCTIHAHRNDKIKHLAGWKVHLHPRITFEPRAFTFPSSIFHKIYVKILKVYFFLTET